MNDATYQLHAISDKDISIKFFSNSSKKPILQHKIHKGFTRTLTFSSPLTLISGGDDKKIVAYNAEAQKMVLEKNVISRILKLANNNLMNLLVTAVKKNKILVNSLSSFKTVDIISLDEEISDVNWLNDTKILVSGSGNQKGFVKIFDLRKSSSAYQSQFFEFCENVNGVKIVNDKHLVAYSDSIFVINFFLLFLDFGSSTEIEREDFF